MDFFSHDRRELLRGGLEHLGVLLRLAHAHVDRDLHDPGRLHHGRVAEPLHQLRLDLALVALLEPRSHQLLSVNF